jgi:hypothetical protein
MSNLKQTTAATARTHTWETFMYLTILIIASILVLFLGVGGMYARKRWF